MRDRIEETYKAIDEMIESDGKLRPEEFGGGYWNAEEEFKIYQKQVGNRYSPLQWQIIKTYFEKKIKEKKENERT